MKSAALIFPHQLFAHHPALEHSHAAWLYESGAMFTRYRFHKQKLVLHRASMKEYASKLQHKIHVRYADLKSFPTIASVLRDMKKHDCREVHVADVVDHALTEELIKAAKQAKMKLIVHETPMFLLTRKEAASMLGGSPKAPIAFPPFYAKIRKKFKVLMTQAGEPMGGQYSFDAENRKRLPKSAPIPELHYPNRCETVGEALDYVKKLFKKNPGHTEAFMYPVTQADATIWLEDFLRHRLAEFGDYEDAIAHDEHALFHSVLSPLLNIGLLTPHQVVEATLRHARRHPIRLNCLEGFLRHVLGWRELVHALYETRGKELMAEIPKHKRAIGKKFVAGTTGILPVDTTVAKVHETGYCHHTERLTVLGNYLLLTETKPEEVVAWFVENFVDGYEWAALPNIYMMAQRLHITSSNYIRNMSDYPAGEWEKVFDALFWRFLSVNESALDKNTRLAALFEQMKKSPERLAKHIALAEGFLKKTR